MASRIMKKAPDLTRLKIHADIGRTIRILHLSDLHGAWFGRGQSMILDMAEKLKPDFAAITGDFIDHTCDEKPSAALLEGLAGIAPVYCVTGNHEDTERQLRPESYERLLDAIERTENAHLLRGETVALTDEITLTGADDLRFAGGLDGFSAYLKGLGEQAAGKYRILLAHRPEWIDAYAAAGFDLTLSGHAHGGQIRLPFTDGLLAPGQGFFPKYTNGLYEHERGMRLVVSRGLGNSVPVPRLFNRREIALIEVGGE